VAAQLRVLRRRIRSVLSTKKITRAQELIAASRIVKARQRVEAAVPYASALLSALEQVASTSSLDHPLLNENREPRRSAVLVITSDRGFAGAYSSNALREAEKLLGFLAEQGQEASLYAVGRKGVSFYRFRDRPLAAEWSGFTADPQFEQAAEIGGRLLEDFLKPTDEGGVDELHIVYTQYVNSVTQRPRARRLLPLVVEEEQAAPGEAGATSAADDGGRSGELQPLYDFEPSPEEVLDALLPKYLNVLVYDALLLSAASEHAARQRAMKSATDNAEELIKDFTREANQARQAEITQEISEIVGGADALAGATAGSE
jgi:F-type H+-transporting ATPase subunit gamma